MTPPAWSFLAPREPATAQAVKRDGIIPIRRSFPFSRAWRLHARPASKYRARVRALAFREAVVQRTASRSEPDQEQKPGDDGEIFVEVRLIGRECRAFHRPERV